MCCFCKKERALCDVMKNRWLVNANDEMMTPMMLSLVVMVLLMMAMMVIIMITMMVLTKEHGEKHERQCSYIALALEI